LGCLDHLPRSTDRVPQARALVTLRAFVAWCKKTRRLLSNPAGAGLVAPKNPHPSQVSAKTALYDRP
jgi:site-specific recombinase XerC